MVQCSSSSRTCHSPGRSPWARVRVRTVKHTPHRNAQPLPHPSATTRGGRIVIASGAPETDDRRNDRHRGAALPSRVALTGSGRTGTPLCGRFVSAGHTVTVFDLRPEREAAVRSLGADWAPSVATAAAGRMSGSPWFPDPMRPRLLYRMPCSPPWPPGRCGST
ncbi:NAD(P)-binding domain-containing protein [Streptomyces sp. NPDC001833]|uniref:NAD(P)-binding domain-containing protein n=1 Tax=Streptomyces sp. NPDC001833 TaxID=3154658 RepID=UPI00332ECD42